MTNQNDTPARSLFDKILNGIEQKKANDKENALMSLLQLIGHAVVDGYASDGAIEYPCPGVDSTPGVVSVAITNDYLDTLKT
jgi:hypothetical protein